MILDALEQQALTRAEYYALEESARRAIVGEEYRDAARTDGLLDRFGRIDGGSR